MKVSRRAFEIFNISFLDIISCGFGAIVLLVLISKTSDAELVDDTNAISDLLKQVRMVEQRFLNTTEALNKANKTLENQKAFLGALTSIETAKNSTLKRTEALGRKLKEDVDGLNMVAKPISTASISRNTAKERDVEVGGIPVDSDYVIFIVDTSGSMKAIWGRVMKVLSNILDIHPKVKGFQILNDNGTYLVSGYAGKWIKDTAKQRKNVLGVLGTWSSFSNSSPVEGLEVALRAYSRAGASVSIYVFGDDYTGSSYDTVINTLDRLNKNRVTGKPILKVHAVGFSSNYTTNRFSILMREVTKRNGGTFLALPR
ncbi:MAG: hypothetical protein A6F72_01550 [Cycloclasticus sp. symbiont of Poecilosclerida sp. N]|nr:MAG: hypothetical protein A6F72_01550 [Cycloclasticus sp. symbiont of Poecilosclerida sp. N]